MIVTGINLLLVGLLILVLGLINPKWLLVWIEKPGRLPIVMLASVVIMIGLTLFGEGTKQKKMALAQQESVLSTDSIPQ